VITDIWLSEYFASVLELNRLLGLRFIWDGKEYKSIGAQTPIGESIMMAGVFHNRQDYGQRDVETAKLRTLVKSLQLIEKYDKKILRKFKKIIKDTAKEQGTYFGVRAEIHIAASLIQKGINFIKTESPDFTIDEYGVYMECTSAHKLEGSSANLTDKIRSAILEKSKKAYCNPSTVLCVDITNILTANVESKNELLASKDHFKGIVKQILTDTNSSYGSVLLFSYSMDLEGNMHTGYYRIDNESAVVALIDFLDKWYPIGEFRIGTGWYYPRAG